MRHITGPYHPLIYNQGNVTNPVEFSPENLKLILEAFNDDSRVTYVSINSRRRYVDEKLLNSLLSYNLSYPLHFIFGLESSSKRSAEILGKNTGGEFKGFIDLLRRYNQAPLLSKGKRYNFGLDVNLVFLPEMYLSDEQELEGNEQIVAEGMRWELEQLLSRIDPAVPVEINLHPFYQVENLPYKSMELSILMRELPGLQKMVTEHNRQNYPSETHLFVGIEGDGYRQTGYPEMLTTWIDQINRFNISGIL